MTPRNKAHYLAQLRLGSLQALEGLREMLLNEQDATLQHIANKHVYLMISYQQGLRDERAEALTELEAVETTDE